MLKLTIETDKDNAKTSLAGSASRSEVMIMLYSIDKIRRKLFDEMIDIDMDLDKGIDIVKK